MFGGQSEHRSEEPSLVASTWVDRAQTVLFNLSSVDDRPMSIGEFHDGRMLMTPGDRVQRGPRRSVQVPPGASRATPLHSLPDSKAAKPPRPLSSAVYSHGGEDAWRRFPNPWHLPGLECQGGGQPTVPGETFATGGRPRVAWRGPASPAGGSPGCRAAHRVRADHPMPTHKEEHGGDHDRDTQERCREKGPSPALTPGAGPRSGPHTFSSVVRTSPTRRDRAARHTVISNVYSPSRPVPRPMSVRGRPGSRPSG